MKTVQEEQTRQKKDLPPPQIPIDYQRLWQYDTWSYNNKKKKRIGCGLATLLLLVTALPLLFVSTHFLFWLLFGISSFVFLCVAAITSLIPTEIKPEEPYTNALIPSMIVSTNPIRLIACEKATIHDDREPFPLRWGTGIVQIDAGLPDTDIRIGQRVVCCGYPWGEDLDYNLYRYMSLYPLCWATSDKDAIARAEAQIPDEAWKRLEIITPQVLTHPAYKEAICQSPSKIHMKMFYFDENLQPDEKLNSNTDKEYDEIED